MKYDALGLGGWFYNFGGVLFAGVWMMGATWWSVCALGLGVGWLSTAQVGMTQNVIVPDETLGVEQSQVIQNFLGLPVDGIVGGAQRGQNLFHSFREFNVAGGRGAYFVAPDLAVQNIFARVTGVNRSEIRGALGTVATVNGNFQASPANLFLLNPNGVFFGPNAKVDVGASFTVTTASGIRFGAAGSFGTSAPQSPSLLTIQPSAFFFGDRPAAKIEVESNQILDLNAPSVRGLVVPVGQKFTLLGGDIELRGGQVNALGGRLELGAIGSNSEVLLQDSGALAFLLDGSFQDIRLTNGAFASTAWNGGGDITIMSRNLLLSDVSIIAAGIFTTLGNADIQAGDINAKVMNSVVIDSGSTLENSVNSNSFGNAGNLIIETSALTIENGSSVNASTFGKGDAGNVTLRVRDKAILNGVAPNGTFSSSVDSFVGSNAVGNGGEVNVEVGSLEVTNGASINASTSGKGNAGNVTLRVRDKARLDGVNPTDGFSGSGVGSSVQPSAVGNGGEVNVEVGSLEVTNGASINASTFGIGDAGNVTLRVREKAILSGVSPNGFSSSGVGSSVQPSAVGNGGEVNVEVGSLEVTNGADISVSSRGRGDAGELSIRSILLKLERGTLSALSEQGLGGNILINNNGLILRRNSLISATSGDGVNPGIEGNISIFSRYIIAIPSENSDIIASSSETRGSRGSSNIDIDSPRIFGLQFQVVPTPRSDIAASGNITVQTLDNSVIQNNLSQLPVDNINPDRLVAQTCLVRQNTGQQGSFYASGNTNLANTPTDINSSTFATASIQASSQQAATDRPWKLGDSIIEPTGFYRMANNTLVIGRECTKAQN